MASPAAPLTPPAEPSSTQPLTQTQTQSSSNAQGSTQSVGPASTRLEALLSQPATSLTDDGTSKRPRDHRLTHLLLASHGVSAYQERVPLQLMDFAYRYTSSTLSDALHIQNEGYDQAEGATQSKGGRGAAAKNAVQKAEEGDVSMTALRMSIASRMSHQFQGHSNLPKEFLKQLADERNRISLNAQARDDKAGPGMTIGGVRLPHERYCLTGAGWGLKEEWDSEGEESVGTDEELVPGAGGDDMQVDELGEGGDDDEEGLGTMEDVFGPDGGGDLDKDGDEEMQDS